MNRDAVSPLRVGRTLVACAFAAAVFGGCGAPADGSAGPDRGATVEEIVEPDNFYEGEYLGRQVTVTASVTAVIDPRSIEIGGAEFGEDSLLVMTTEPVAAQVGDVVRASGTVGQFHRLAEDDYAPVTYDRYEEYETEAYLYGATVASG
ncbi:MAG: hypothetical protein ACT4RN_08350 [Pseudonocardia sp.]